LSHKYLTAPHRPTNHRLKATALEMEGTVKKTAVTRKRRREMQKRHPVSGRRD